MSDAIKADNEKNRLDLLPFDALTAVGRVLTFGAQKYAAYNWMKGMKWHRLFGAALRHMFAWWYGEDKDPETGESHLAHALCCLMFLVEYETIHQEGDDRPKTQKTNERPDPTDQTLSVLICPHCYRKTQVEGVLSLMYCGACGYTVSADTTKIPHVQTIGSTTEMPYIQASGIRLAEFFCPLCEMNWKQHFIITGKVSCIRCGCDNLVRRYVDEP